MKALPSSLSPWWLLAAPLAAAQNATTLTFPDKAPVLSCAASSPGTPVRLPSLSTANGPKTILLKPQPPSPDAAGDGVMCVLSRWSLDDTAQESGEGHYYPLGRSVPGVDGGDWTEPPGRPGRDLEYECGEAAAGGAGFEAGERLCAVTLPQTKVTFADYTYRPLLSPYYLTYYERSLGARSEISRFLHKTTFGPTPGELDALEAAHAALVSVGSSPSEAMTQLQVEWVEAQMDPSTFSAGTFTSLRKYWRKRVNARAFEVYRIGMAGPAPCERESRWRRFAFTNYDVQSARYLRWGDEGVTKQSQNPHKITVRTVDLRAPAPNATAAPSPLPAAAPTRSPVRLPTLSPTLSSSPTGSSILGYGDFEPVEANGTASVDAVDAAWASSCRTGLIDASTDPDDVRSGRYSYNVTGGRCMVLRSMGSGCPTSRMPYQLAEGDVVRISLWVKTELPAQVFQVYTAHYHARKAGAWARPADDSHAIVRTLVDNAGKWKKVEAIHTVGPDWTYDGAVLVPKLCNHYQLRFNLAGSTSGYIMDEVRIERIGRANETFAEEERQAAFLRNPRFVSGHEMWKMAASSGTITYDSLLRRSVMSLKRGQVARQEILSSSTPGASYSFGFWARLLNSDRAVTLKVIIRMRFTNGDLIYGPCKNPVCNLYERPVTLTLPGGKDHWQHVAADPFEMYGNYSAWNGTVDFILFQVLASGMPVSGELRLADFHDLTESTVPPSASPVPSASPTTLIAEDVAYVVSYAGDVRTVLYRPFQIDATGEVLPMDGSAEYVLCEAEEVEGSLSESPKGMGFIVDDRCARIRGGNPTVNLDPRYVNMTDLYILDLSDTNSSIATINAEQTYGGDLLLLSDVEDEVCSTFPSPYDNDYRGLDAANPDAVPNRFDPDENVFALLPDGTYAIYDPRIILQENTLENPLMDGGGETVLRSTLRSRIGYEAVERFEGSGDYFVANDQNIVLCANEHPNFLNRDHCVLSYEPNACAVEKPTYINEMQRHTFVNVQLTLKFDDATLAAIHAATAATSDTNATASNSQRYIYAVSNLRYDETNTNGTYPLPCLPGNPRSRWIPRQDLDASTCTNSLKSSSTAALANALETSNDQNTDLRDIYLWNSVAEDGCDPADEMEYGMLVMTEGEGCWQNVPPDHMSVYDFTQYVSEHPTSSTSDTSITGFADSGILAYPENHPMSYFEALKNVRISARKGAKYLLQPVARYGDMMIVDEFAKLVGLNKDPVALKAVAGLGEIRLNNVINKNRNGGTLVCGSINEVVPDPTLDDFFDVMHADLDCVGCQKSYGDYFGQKQTVWTINAIESEDQLCGRMAWALYELVNVGTTTAPDNTESNLQTYDVFQRHCFGNYYDILKEMSYNPKMGEQFGYVMSTSTRFFHDKGGTYVYPDENYAREIMQLYTIGLHFLNEDGTDARDQFGRSVQTYTNRDILSNARIWSGFEYTARRGNVEELFRANKSRQDPMRIEIDKHDFFPKFTLGSWIGDRYPLCTDLPRHHFLKVGAVYHLRGGTSTPSFQSMSESWDADEAVKRFVLSPTSSLYEKLCNAGSDGVCRYANTVTIEENLPCDGKECRVETLITVQVAPGVFYEYIRQPCVLQMFYENPTKVIGGIDVTLDERNQYSHAMCADPKTTAAARSCCDADGNKIASYNYKFEYHGERVTAAKNEEICAADGLSVCDPNTVIAQAPLVLNKALYNFVYPSQNTFFWTDAACTQQVRIRPDGMMTIVHDTVKNTNVMNEAVVPFVSLEKSVTYITMPWDQDIYTLDYLYPSSEDNSCDDGACSTLEDGSCLCPVTVSEGAAYASLPTRDEILSTLHIGGFDPASYSDSSAPYSLVDSNSEVEAYSTGALGDASTIFKVTDERRETVYLKNTLLNITIGSSYTTRNPPTFINLPKVDELDAVYEVEAFIRFLMAHPNTPPFVSKKLIQYFGVSNPSPGYAFRVTQAFKEGAYSKNGITFGDGTYGNLAAVAAAITLDPEALNVVLDDDPINGNVREPLLKVVQTLRSLSFTRRSEVKFANGLLKDMPWKIGQMVFQPPDQFSFFSSDYSPPGIIYGLDMVSPESQLLSMSSVVGITNGFFSLFNFGLSNADGGFGPFMSTSREIGDYSTSVGVVTYQVNATDVASKIDDLDVIMTGGRLSIENKQVMTDAYNYFITAHDVETADRVLMGLVAASPEFHTTNTLKKTGAKRAVTPPAAKSSEPYKAIVYIYIAGGIDSFNILAPHSDSGCYLYDNYYEARGGVDGIGLTTDDMLTIDGSSAGIEGCPTFGVNKLMSSYKEIFDEGKGIFLANMGHLHKAVHKSNWMTETRTDLFSHHTMKREAQYADAFREGAGPGVLGRMCDILEGFGHAVSAISVNTQAPMVDGDPGLGRYADAMSTQGLPKIFERQFLNGRTGQELRMFLEDLNAETTSNSGVMANIWSQRFIDVWDKTDKLVATMRGTVLQTAFPQSGPDIDEINQQLKLVAQLIAARDKRGNGKNRDVFFVQMGGFDTHSEEAKILAGRLPALNQAVGNFWAEIKAQGLANSVTVIQGSEFGRTISTNSNGGTDHAWGGNYFMFGGDVAGGKILGEYPRSFDESDPTNIGRGRLIPTHSWDSMWYGVSQWFGILEHADLAYVLPNNANFGCDLFMDSDLFTSGTNRITGCGGPKFDAPADMDLSEARFLTGEEQKALCYITTQVIAKQFGLNAEDSRCFISDMVVAPSAQVEGMFTVSCIAKLSFDLNVPPELISAEKINSIMAIASNTASSRVVKGAIVRTEAPSASPSMAPSISPAPTTETAAPTRAPVTPAGLAFVSSDIGYCAYEGESYETSDGLYNLKGSGADIWGTADGFHYMYVESSGDADFIALIKNFSKDKNEWAKAGIMFRASLAKDAAHYSSVLTGNHGIANQFRRCPACVSESQSITSVNPSSIWMRVTKVGTVMTAYYKEISSSYWVQYGLELSMPAISSNGYYVGIFITSHDNSNPDMATLQVSNVDLFRTCESSAITVEQCDQATNCELGLRTATCYDIGTIRTRKVKIHLPGTNYLHLAEIQVFDQYGENVALNKPASMSSVYDPNYFPYPGDGVDGIIEGSMFHTDIEKGPWWEVDLGDGLPEVAEVMIYNRNFDCNNQCQARANNAIISLIDGKGQVFDSRDVGVVVNTVRRRAQTTYVPIGVPFSPISIGTYQTRKVKIQLTTTNALHLTEVQVFDESGVNRALNKLATMSSIYVDSKGPYHSNPGEALDGITTGENMFHTTSEFGAWWEVDLGAGLVNVKKVVIYNRQDDPSTQGRLSNAKVSLIDAYGDVFDYKNLGDTSNVGLLNLDFAITKKSVLPPKESEAAGYFEFFGEGWCRDATERMYDYLRFYIEGVSAQACQDKCAQHFSGLVGISTYSSSYCYCWYDNSKLPSPLPSDVHGYSAKYAGKGEVTVTLNEQDGDCYKFYETVVDTQTPTQRPTPPPTIKPTAAPTNKPTQKPTVAGDATVEGDHVYLGDGWCKDKSNRYYDYLRFDGVEASPANCAALCPSTTPYRGLSTYMDSYCYCWYSNNQLPTGTYASSIKYDAFDGTGHIDHFEYTGYSTCYRFDSKA